MKNDSQSVVSSLNAPRIRGLSGSPGVPPQQLLGLLAAVPAEVGVQQVHHRPQVPALLDVDLEQVAQVVQARRGGAEVALLLDRGGLGVALDDDQPPQVAAVLAGHLLPGGLALVLAERDLPRSRSRSDRKMPHRYCSIGTLAQLAQPSRPIAIAVRR